MRASLAISTLWASSMETKKYRYVKLKSCIIRVGTLSVESSFRVFSNPVERIRSVRDATQNHIRTVKTANFITPSIVTDRLMPPRLVAQTGDPAVRNSTGMEITAANIGIRAVLEMKCLKGMREAAAKTRGTIQIASRYERLVMRSEAIIIPIMATSLAIGLMACMTPFLPLKSST